ncbi:3-hydroxyacyl-CoA dehydrogenase NAD-binding domain-containing protein [Arthrobacter sp. NPDC090010]|uniref:3-hydroxyacyl-CoA dehydrogenase NAD-binding domain-containing protein n=1 Tax=Arthrobacter sp. NPDC090010 TaxID=3363942 RepID=UPI0038300620
MKNVVIIGAGVIGLSWARLFAENGWNVQISDPRPDLTEVVERELRGVKVHLVTDLPTALREADFVQEAGPERMDIKREMYANLAEHTRDDVILASSSSSLLPSLIAEGNPAAHRILIGHPFNPPELMPLVEVVPGPATEQRHVDRAVELYRELGKLPIALKREIPGFVGNRLQKALGDQARYLVQEGIISAGELDQLVRASLGLRWAVTGPFESNHLGGGPGGIRHLMEHVGSQMTFEMGEPDPAKTGEIVTQVEAAYGTGPENYERLAAWRDETTRAVSRALAAHDGGASAGTEAAA